MTRDTNRSAIILAGGEGTRLAGLTRREDGAHVPKQFCALIGDTPLLQQTRRRVARSVPTERILFALGRDHEQFFSPLLADTPAGNLVVQACGRGTSPAILYSVLRLAEMAPDAAVLLVPSDHHVGDEVRLMKYVDLAFDATEHHPELIVLLGVTAESPETSYGWIEPGLPRAARQDLFAVQRFWEKPSRQLANQLMVKRFLWNSFMLVANVSTLLGLFIVTTPELYFAFSKIRRSIGTMFEEEVIGRLYENLRPSDFSRQVLEPSASRLSVLPVSNVGWTDLGEPHRVAITRGQSGSSTKADSSVIATLEDARA